MERYLLFPNHTGDIPPDFQILMAVVGQVAVGVVRKKNAVTVTDSVTANRINYQPPASFGMINAMVRLGPPILFDV